MSFFLPLSVLQEIRMGPRVQSCAINLTWRVAEVVEVVEVVEVGIEYPL